MSISLRSATLDAAGDSLSSGTIIYICMGPGVGHNFFLFLMNVICPGRSFTTKISKALFNFIMN